MHQLPSHPDHVWTPMDTYDHLCTLVLASIEEWEQKRGQNPLLPQHHCQWSGEITGAQTVLWDATSLARPIYAGRDGYKQRIEHGCWVLIYKISSGLDTQKMYPQSLGCAQVCHQNHQDRGAYTVHERPCPHRKIPMSLSLRKRPNSLDQGVVEPQGRLWALDKIQRFLHSNILQPGRQGHDLWRRTIFLQFGWPLPPLLDISLLPRKGKLHLCTGMDSPLFPTSRVLVRGNLTGHRQHPG